MACTLKTWQVKTIRPIGWSPDDGEGMEVVTVSGLEVGEGTGVKLLKLGVLIGSVWTGGCAPEGVEACRVANRSSVGDADGARKLHPRMKSSAAGTHSDLLFFMFQLDRFKVEFLTG